MAQSEPAQHDLRGVSSANRSNGTESPQASYPASPALAFPDSDPLNILDHQRNVHLPSDLHLRDLELMHHYSTVSYKTISRHSAFMDSFQFEVPKIALSYPFLMHGLLALSASHLVHLNKDSERVKEYEELAFGHQTLALRLFRGELDNITPSNSEAMFAFSSIVTVLGFASLQTTGVQSLPPIDEMLQTYNLCRGVSEILQTSNPWLKTSNSWVPNVLASMRMPEKPLPADIEKNISLLFKLNSDLTVTGQTMEETAASENAISEISTTFQQVHSGFAVAWAFRWPICVAPIFISNLRDRRPMALVLLAHYCILLHKMDDFWWMKGWPRRLLHSIYTTLAPSWRDAIRWPVEVIGLSSPGE
ncbi:uncharacterized protein TRUGW13939_04993 [Talaromyces rugulosus]|uniref:C6 transcription factor n=1 Tax=Talaromyces rugulosus TaxID=121627 RepID=A0A7H8QYP0_TALRU|nr:uncharacterized protein TRUGW13939_04993 [Talaromyces rugulosus]QKX57873.1 hypothetical protein TRUGW13939_04993 [Talaromyces rugulosus]